MKIYTYNELKNLARKVRAELATEGIFIKKTVRLKERDKEKIDLLYQMAMNRLKKYPPKKTEKGIILPYYQSPASG